MQGLLTQSFQVPQSSTIQKACMSTSRRLFSAARSTRHGSLMHKVEIMPSHSTKRPSRCHELVQRLPTRQYAAGASSSSKAKGDEEGKTDDADKEQAKTDTERSLPSWVFFLLGPGTVASIAVLVALTRRKNEDQFREAAHKEFEEGCPELPKGALEALLAARVVERETNHAICSSSWVQQETMAHWRLEVHARRSSPWQSWNIVLLRASRGTEVTSAAGEPLAQVRHWNPQAVQVEWRLVWEKASQDDVLVKARLIR